MMHKGSHLYRRKTYLIILFFSTIEGIYHHRYKCIPEFYPNLLLNGAALALLAPSIPHPALKSNLKFNLKHQPGPELGPGVIPSGL